MTSQAINPPYPIFYDVTGAPLTGGYIYIGIAGSDPQSSPATAYWDAALTQTASQPIRTSSGFPLRAGSPARLYIGSDYSIKVLNKNGTLIYSSLYCTERVGGFSISGLDASSVSTTQTGSTVARTQLSKNTDMRSVVDYGVVGDGTTDDTTALQLALNTHKHVYIPAGLTPLVSITVTIPDGGVLEMLGGYGNTASGKPPTYLIKKSTMTTPALVLSYNSCVIGGGVVCESGNSGDGIALRGNGAALRSVYVKSAGENGVRVGVDGTHTNTNKCILDNVHSYNNTGHGIYLHDGAALGIGADCNVASVTNCVTAYNGGSGIKVGHCFWTTLLNNLCSENTGYGLLLSGATDGKPSPYPECRFATVIGGDYDEGNDAGFISDEAYFSSFFGLPFSQIPTDLPNGLQGSACRNFYGHGNVFTGATIDTHYSKYPLAINHGALTTPTYADALTILARTTNTEDREVDITFLVDTTGYWTPSSPTIIKAASVSCTRNSSSSRQDYGLVLKGCNNGTTTNILELKFNPARVVPSATDTFSLGTSSLAWLDIFTKNAVTVTSDGREKQQIRDLTESERIVATKLKRLIRAFKFNTDVEIERDKAKIHFGVIAQDVKRVFESEGLLAEDYSLFSDDEGRLGIRYTELLAFIIGAT